MLFSLYLIFFLYRISFFYLTCFFVSHFFCISYVFFCFLYVCFLYLKSFFCISYIFSLYLKIGIRYWLCMWKSIFLEYKQTYFSICNIYRHHFASQRKMHKSHFVAAVKARFIPLCALFVANLQIWQQSFTFTCRSVAFHLIFLQMLPFICGMGSHHGSISNFSTGAEVWHILKHTSEWKGYFGMISFVFVSFDRENPTINHTLCTKCY